MVLAVERIIFATLGSRHFGYLFRSVRYAFILWWFAVHGIVFPFHSGRLRGFDFFGMFLPIIRIFFTA